MLNLLHSTPAPSHTRQGFTATAYRRSARESRELLRLYGEPVYATSINTMIKNGYLCDVSRPMLGSFRGAHLPQNPFCMGVLGRGPPLDGARPPKTPPPAAR
jgi:hypothetical protein